LIARAWASANTIVSAARDAASMASKDAALRAHANVLCQNHTLAASEAGVAARDAAIVCFRQKFL